MVGKFFAAVPSQRLVEFVWQALRLFDEGVDRVFQQSEALIASDYNSFARNVVLWRFCDLFRTVSSGLRADVGRTRKMRHNRPFDSGSYDQ